MSTKFEECNWDSFVKSIYAEKEEYEPPTNDTIVSSQSLSDVSIVNGIFLNSGSQRDRYVYKRRKLHRSSVALFPEGNTIANTQRTPGYQSCISSEDYLLAVQKADIERSPIISSGDCACGQHCKKSPVAIHTSDESVANSEPYNICSTVEFEVLAKASDRKSYKSALQHCSNVNDRHLSLKSNVERTSTFLQTETEDIREFSMSEVVELVGEFTSARELCIYVLKSHGLLGKSWASSNNATLQILCDDNTKLSQKCKTCGLLDDPRKMLICDHCEEAYHMSCCIPRVKELPVDEWYCQPCFKKKPKPLFSKSSNTEGESSNHTNQISHGGYSISFMLKDTKPYTTGVRIGKDFQVEVPDWSHPVSNEDDYFAELYQMDSAEFANMNGCNGRTSQKPLSIGNWIQCREVLHSDGSDEGIVCGKWRRAPLFVVQSDDWDCSCSVLWDPIHADCAVPQELDTEEVLKHLKFIKWLRPRLNDKSRKPTSI